jgi:hypothetical protein
MVEEGTWAWQQVDRSELFRASLPGNVVAPLFANRAVSLVLANYGQVDVSLETNGSYISLNDPSISATTRWSLAPRSLLMLKTT